MDGTNGTDSESIKTTPLHDSHVALGAKMVPFTGYSMPLQYPTGILKEHFHTRESASLFDVSHMGQISIWGDGAAHALEWLVPGDIIGLAPWSLRYTQFTNAEGGIRDDLMVTNAEGRLLLVVNAACKDADLGLLEIGFRGAVDVAMHNDKALIALQGPAAAAVMARHAPASAALKFMTAGTMKVAGADAIVSRSGYTGEDGFEISVYGEDARHVWEALAAAPEVAPAGLGARDSLRLEAGLCLYGHDIDETTSPVEAGLLWSIGKRRREEGGFPGAERIQAEIADGATRRRVGILPEGRAPVRENTEILSAGDEPIGKVTSGGFGPSAGGPVAMGYVDAAHAKAGNAVGLMLRGKKVPASIVKLPFTAHRYHKD
ncbi:MAG: glycine cleavage system aminomethyltransferase GcvT [Rhodospirillaceae bacterium]|nr:glycine cleavage system aminomethyltransferase GcvT [Rhodospirillaceae bacterium]MBT3928565.1 glycine cleavage system aminomethyltransferase GcvT [Rhodospirillaceae bacterium]MBT4425611.1 glycine cleavage system aminomethyltransferase GcvT [Rhodospirillaceae bacterium]MBT5039856.1 glycine cleavage system aminomethyltransferase GcvT [Rhodospirillaceae bacterium]MBT5674285.1 glycine cleavage system aminomethyltransferase GcvT [Rhodospirillaceae bacterium]